MIKGAHAMFFTPKADELRAFIRDTLRLPHADVGGGWLIFDPRSAEIGCHPSEKVFHDISFYCDDIHKTIAELKERGVKFTSGVSDQGFGLVTRFKMPGDVEVTLYQPKYSQKIPRSAVARTAKSKRKPAKAARRKTKARR